MMRGEQQIRTLMGPADPARAVPVPPPPVVATELIARAQARTSGPERRRPALARRPLLAGGGAAVVVAAVAAYALVQPAPDRPGAAPGPGVVVPIAYEITDDPPPAAPYLRELAARLSDAPYDGQTGAYAYLHLQNWGHGQVASTDGRHVASYVSESEWWIGADGTGTYRYTNVGVEFPDEESRRYWEANPQPGWADLPETTVYPYSLEDDVVAHDYVEPDEPIPTDPAERIDQMIGVDIDGDPHFTRIDLLYERHLVPRDLRAAVLEALADVPGVVWRGEVTDRAGRSGVAVTYDGVLDAAEPVQHVLIFQPQTGELLAHEIVRLQASWVNVYTLYLDAGWTDDPGPAPSTRPAPSPTA
jgi:hypothetical protein